MEGLVLAEDSKSAEAQGEALELAAARELVASHWFQWYRKEISLRLIQTRDRQICPAPECRQITGTL